jgi:hypothetical protein
MHRRAEEGLNDIAIFGLFSSYSVRDCYICDRVICANPNGAALRKALSGAAAPDLRAAVPGAYAVNAFDEFRTLGTLSERGWCLAGPRRYSQQQQDQG